MARYPFPAPKIEVIDQPAGEGFYISPGTNGPRNESELIGLRVELQKKGLPQKFMAMQFVKVAEYPARMGRFAVQNMWDEGTYRVVYARGRAHQSYYSDAVTVKWPGTVLDYVES